MKADGWHRLWFNFGGINRGVSIRRIGASEISYPEMNTKLGDGAAVVDLKVHLRNNLEPRALGVKGTLSARRPQASRSSSRPSRWRSAAPRCSQTQVRVENPDLWSPAAPNLWDLELEVPGESTYRARVGLREVRAEGPDLLLNGKPIRLRGASIHEDVFGRGDALRPVDQDRIVEPPQGDRRQRDALPASDRPGPARALRRRRDHGLAGRRADRRARRLDLARREARARGPKTACARASARPSCNPSIITWNLANEVAGGGHPEGQIPYVDSMAAELKRDRPEPADRARHLGRAPAARSPRGSTATST